MFGGRPKVKELSWQRPVFKIACLKTKEKVCRKEKPGKEDEFLSGWMKAYKLGSCGE
jgi:hypothetical protein